MSFSIQHTVNVSYYWHGVKDHGHGLQRKLMKALNIGVVILGHWQNASEFKWRQDNSLEVITKIWV
jgi:hypothetical protein